MTSEPYLKGMGLPKLSKVVPFSAPGERRGHVFLDGHLPVQGEIRGLVDDAKTSDAQHPLDAKLAQTRARLQRAVVARSGRDGAFGAGRAQDDLFQPPFRRFQLGFAMGLQRLAALVQENGILKIHLALLQPGDNGFQFAQGRLEAEAGDLDGFGGDDRTAPDP